MMKKSLLSIKVAILAILLSSYPLFAATLKSWRFDPQTNQLEFIVEQETTPRYFVLTDPPRIVVDLPNTELGKVQTQQNFTGLVRQVRISQFEESVTRLVLELSPLVTLSSSAVQLQKLKTEANQTRWLLRPLLTQTNQTASPVSLTELPPASFPSGTTAITVRVPPLPRRTPATTTVPVTSTTANSPVIDFGQPFPSNSRNTPRSELILKAGTKLKLRYAGESSLILTANKLPQEVLLLEEEIRAPQGKIIANKGTHVIGRFAMDEQGIYFVTQAIAIGNMNYSLLARSASLQNTVTNNPSTIQSVTIEPGFIIQVELTQDWRY